MGSVTLDNEIKRLTTAFSNHVEPLRVVTIITMDGDMAIVEIAEMEEQMQVPVMKPVTGGTVDLNPDDKAIMAFIGGVAHGALIIGKL